MRALALVYAMILVVGLGACEDVSTRAFAWAQTGVTSLGDGYFLVSDGGDDVTIGRGEEPYDGSVSVVVPPAVVRTTHDDTHVIAATAHCSSVEEYLADGAPVLDGGEECYWIISKRSGDVRGPLAAAEFDRARAAEGVAESLSLGR